MVVVIAASVGQAVRGNAVVNAQRSPTAVRDAKLDDAFYDCLSIQAHSIVSPGEPVFLVGTSANLTGIAEWVTLIKGVGTWVTFSGTPSTARVELVFEDHVTGRPACLGNAVATRSIHDGRVTVRYGSGADVPGMGPPPAPVL
jgi:hypothetical protein